MRWGLIARAEDRGLGVMTWELARALYPDRVLVIDPQDARFTMHLDRYKGHDTTLATFWNGELNEALVRSWLDGLDVVYSAETFYDWRVCTWAREAGVATICHGMPEFYRHAQNDWPEPASWWWPTDWLVDRIPAGPVVPVPVPDDAPLLHGDPHEAGPLRIVHVAGHLAHADRNGTRLLFAALRRITEPVHVTVWAQDRLNTPRMPAHVTLELRCGGVADRWEQYRGAHVLVMPRRYGGLCLPVQEALAAGVAVVMTDTPWNRRWPIVPVPLAASQARLQLPVGQVTLSEVDTSQLARLLSRLARDRDEVYGHQLQARLWTERNRWSALAGVYQDQLLHQLTT